MIKETSLPMWRRDALVIEHSCQRSLKTFHPVRKCTRELLRNHDEKMQVIRHQDKASNKVSSFESCAAKLLKRIENALIREDRLPTFHAPRHKIERAIRKHPIQPLKALFVL